MPTPRTACACTSTARSNGRAACPRTRTAVDSLDLRLRRTVPAGQALRVTASAETKRSTRLRLTITADEED